MIVEINFKQTKFKYSFSTEVHINIRAWYKIDFSLVQNNNPKPNIYSFVMSLIIFLIFKALFKCIYNQTYIQEEPTALQEAENNLHQPDFHNPS